MTKDTFGVEKLGNIDETTFGPLFDIPLIKKGIYCYQKSFREVLSSLGKDEICLVSGRCPSKKINLIHLLHYQTFAAIQKKIDSKMVFCLSPEEAYLNKGYEFDEANELAFENLKSIISMGFKPKKTYFVWCTKNMNQNLFNLALKVSKRITFNMLKKAFGGDFIKNSGSILIPPLIISEILYPSFYLNARSLTLFALSHEVYLRLADDLAENFGIKKPSSLFYKDILDLRGGVRTDPSEEGALYLQDDEEVIKNKIMKAFTGGKDTKSEQLKNGGNADVCSVFEYLTYFEEDVDKIQQLREKCVSGFIMCNDCKLALLDLVNSFLKKTKEKTSKLNDMNTSDLMYL